MHVLSQIWRAEAHDSYKASASQRAEVWDTISQRTPCQKTFYMLISTSAMLLDLSVVWSLKGQVLHIHHESTPVPDRAMWFTGTNVFILQVTETCTKRFRRYQIPSLGIVPLNGSQKLKVLTRHSEHHLKNVNFKGFSPEKSKQTLSTLILIWWRSTLCNVCDCKHLSSSTGTFG